MGRSEPASRRTHTRTGAEGRVYEQRSKAKGHGEGTIYQRKDTGRWCASVTLLGGKRKYLYGRTREEVARRLTKALHDLQQGIEPPDDRETVSSWVTQYLDDLETRGTAHATVVRYRGILRNYLRPQLGKVKLSRLQPQQVQTYQAGLIKRGFSSRTITLHRTLLGGALKQAMSFGLIPRNVVALVKPPREDRESKGKMLTPDQARALLDAVRGDRLEAFYLVLLTAGLRRGEALGLRWADLELDGPAGGTLHVRQQLQWPNGVPTLVPVKSRKSVRSVPLPAVTVAALRERQARQQSERQAVGEDAWRAEGLVFNAEDGAPLHRNTATKQFHARIKAAGLEHLRLRPHDLRHTYGSLLMSQGVPLKTISDLMGHASIEVTANIYLHSLDVQVRDTARSLEKALAAPVPDAPGRCPTCGQHLPQIPVPRVD